MTDKEIQEGNKLIAEFMEDYDLYHWGRDPFNEMMKATYHEDWNTLMPVVEKIETLSNEICDKYFWKLENHTDFRIFRIGKINDLWLAVVGFIEWYNQNKK